MNISEEDVYAIMHLFGKGFEKIISLNDIELVEYKEALGDKKQELLDCPPNGDS